ncbi:MAG TPA: Rieske 2Fe-2S domain-containing protein [Acidimicrobiales bacterium]|nr:Rieske 2Fe-2S domain-containing protein [Acidimicrobiales bacterium]
MALRQVMCPAGDLAPGEMIRAQLGPMPVVVIRTATGDLYGLVDKCLHQGGPLSRGMLMDRIEGTCGQVGSYEVACGADVVRCPWHGYEYDVRTGATLVDPERRLRTVRVW